MNDIWTIRRLLEWSQGYFERKGLPTPRLDAEVLLAHALNKKRMELYLNFDQPLTTAEREAFKALLLRRGEREPLAYITGEVGFWSFMLECRPGCLIPRPETEILVEAALEALKALEEAGLGGHWAAEVGTGSGAIPLALCHERRGLKLVSVEKEAPAQAVAAANLARHASQLAPKDNRVALVRGDRLEPLAQGFAPALLVSNPPYVERGVIAGLEPEVSLHEPASALDGGPDGLDFYRYLVDWSAARLAPGGRLAVEIGADQAEGLAALVAAKPELELLEIRKDLARRPRVAVAAKRP